MNMLRFPKRRTPWLTARCLLFNTLDSCYGVVQGLKIGRREYMNGTARENIKPGQPVLIVLKQDQRSGRLTRGVVKDILTKSPTHPHGIKVRLESGEIGRVKEIVA
jgi:uncharacterized repeat protein (TIGR03833 family)